MKTILAVPLLLITVGCVESAPSPDPVPIPLSIPAPLVAEFQRVCLDTGGDLSKVRQILYRSGRYGDVEHADLVGPNGGVGAGIIETARRLDDSEISATIIATDAKRECTVGQNRVDVTRMTGGTVSILQRKGLGS